jgi:hypothetical protein
MPLNQAPSLELREAGLAVRQSVKLGLSPSSHMAFTLPRQLPSLRWNPKRYRPNGIGYWSGHTPFACDLVALAGPSVLVELGVHYGESYFAFCQAIAETGTHCEAVEIQAVVLALLDKQPHSSGMQFVQAAAGEGVHIDVLDDDPSIILPLGQSALERLIHGGFIQADLRGVERDPNLGQPPVPDQASGRTTQRPSDSATLDKLTASTCSSRASSKWRLLAKLF